LAAVLARRREVGPGAVVLGLPRGGLPVASEVARALAVPLDVLMVRKLGVPAQPELAMGAICEGGFLVVNDEVLRAAHITVEGLREVETRQRAELDGRSRSYRRGLPAARVSGRDVLIVDDGMATGSTARVACLAARARGAARVVVAAPVASRSAVRAVRPVCDDVVCLVSPEPFVAVGAWYDDFFPTTDGEVAEILRRAGLRRRRMPS
jgi:putative phosphoribosyl transferase